MREVPPTIWKFAHTGHASDALDTQVMLVLNLIDIQYLQKAAVFSVGKGSNHQNDSFSGSHHLVKKSNFLT